MNARCASNTVTLSILKRIKISMIDFLKLKYFLLRLIASNNDVEIGGFNEFCKEPNRSHKHPSHEH